MLPRSEVSVFAHRGVAHADRLVLGAEGEGQDVDVAAAADVAAQDLADGGHGLHGVDLPRGTGQTGERAGVVAQIGADVDADVARTDELRQVVDVLRGRRAAADAEPLPEEEEPAYGPQVLLERERAVEDPVDEAFQISLCN